jgi:molecular chaperone DnaK (HSP70)
MEINNEDDFIINFIKKPEESIKIEEDLNDYIIGIDLGTTNSCCSVYKDNKIHIIPDEKGNKYIPSYVGYTNINKYVGFDAKNQSIINSDNVYYEVKRLIGLKYTDENVQKEKQFLSYKYTGDTNENIRLISSLGYDEFNLKTFSPEEISAQVLIKLKQMASSYLKKDIKRAVITIPARFTDAQRQATYDSATIAGLTVERMIHEPTAAAISYGLASRKLEKDEIINVLVYDFGGGTLDVSIVEISVDENNHNIFTVLGSAGNTHIGGADFDNKLVGFALNKFKHKYGIELKGVSSLSMQKLKQSCENAKKILSVKSKTQISIKDFHDNKDLIFNITRSDLEIICGDLLLICLKPIDDVLDCCNLSIDEIDEIILVGGMTRMPSIQNRIEMKFKKKPNLSLNPDEAISIGASYQGAILSGILNPHTDNLTLLDITPLSLGVDTLGVMDVLIERNTIIPYSISKTYTTDSDYKKSVLIKIYEGERTLTTDNIFVGEFELSGIEEAPRGIPKIEVTFSIDVNGIVTVTAEDKKSNEKSSIIVNSNKGRLSKQEILKLIEEAKELEIRDEIERRKKMMHYEIEDLCTNISANLNNSNFKLSEHNKVIIKEDITILIEWLKSKKYYERSDDELEKTLENLKKRYGTLIVKGKLEQDKEVKLMEYNNGTSVYENEDDENINLEDENNIINIVDEEKKNIISEEELNEIKELRKTLFDLCYSIFDIICNDGFIIDKNDRQDLKDYIDDTLLWLHVHDKPTKIEYKQKIDEVNEACDKIINEYETKDKNIFNISELMKKTDSKTELENLAFTLKIMIDENKTFLKTEQINKLKIKLEEIFDFLYKIEDNLTNNNNNDNNNDIYNIKKEELNTFCDELYNEINGINFNVNVINTSNIILDNTSGGTDIETLLKLRQEDDIKQLLIDNDENDNLS